MPFLVFTGQEAWRVKEAKESTPLGIKWEITTAVSMIHAGADLVIMRHPKAAGEVMKFIGELMKHG
jgi:acetyl-CoA decarbonylase/synthase complex subunit delta